MLRQWSPGHKPQVSTLPCLHCSPVNPPANPQASAIPSTPSVPVDWDFGDTGTGVYWGNWGALGYAAPWLMPEVEQHRSHPSPAPCGCASILQHNKLQNNPAKQGAPAPPNPLAVDPQKGIGRAVSHPSTCCTSSSHPTFVYLDKKVSPSLLPAPHPRLPGCRISEQQSPSCKTTNLFILNINGINQMSRQEKDRFSSGQAESTGRSTRQIISSFFKPAGYNE